MIMNDNCPWYLSGICVTSILVVNIQKIDEKTISELFKKVLGNYIKWCKYLGVRVAWNRWLVVLSIFREFDFFYKCPDKYGVHCCSLEAINRNRKVILISLYFLIWGEAANVRFLPECICYIFHHVSMCPLFLYRLM